MNGPSSTRPDTPPRAGRRARPGWWRRARTGPLAFGLLGAAAFVASVRLSWPGTWQGVLLAVPLMIATTGFGWRAAVPLVPLGLALAWVNGAFAVVGGPWLPLAGLALAMLLASAAGHNLFSLWQATEAHAHASETRARLLREAALELHHARSEDELLESVPRLLSDILDFAHADVFVPAADAMVLRTSLGWDVAPGYRIPLTSVTGRAARSAAEQYVGDTLLEPAYVGIASAGEARSELALPVSVDGRVRAVVNVEHAEPHAFAADDRRTLRAFVQIVEEVMVRLASLEAVQRERSAQEFLGRLNQRLLRAEGAREAAAITLDEVLPALRLDDGLVVVLRAGLLRPLAVSGDVPASLRRSLAAGIELAGAALEAWESKTITVIGEGSAPERLSRLRELWGAASVAVVPIVSAAGEMQALLILGQSHGARSWGAAERRTLEIIAGSLGVVLDRATLNRQLLAMLDVMRGLARADDAPGLYRRAAESAVRLIPGVEAASILVRGPDGFRFAATVGFELDKLQEFGAVTEDEGLLWYGHETDDYRRGVPRMLTGAAIAPRSAAASLRRGFHATEAARVQEIRANICAPITDHGEVVGLLNLDSFTREDAFGTTALRLAEAYAQQVGAILRQAAYVATLRRTAVTDPLTGLGNREGFNRRLDEELLRARRYQHPLAVVMLDLDNFKRVNDRLGHQAGDEALVAVAGVLEREQRASDCAFRWGGDEFVVLLPEVGPVDARRAGERFARRIEGVQVRGMTLATSVGIASYPDDGEDREALLRRADALMYGRKQQPRNADASG